MIRRRAYGAFYVSLLFASMTEILWILQPWTEPGHCCRRSPWHSQMHTRAGAAPAALARGTRLAYPTSPLFFVVESYLTTGVQTT